MLDLLNDTYQEELRAGEIERTSEQNYQAARNTLISIEDIYKFNILQIQRFNDVLLLIFSQMLNNVSLIILI